MNEDVNGRRDAQDLTAGMRDSIEVTVVSADGFDQSSRTSSLPSLTPSRPETPDCHEGLMPLAATASPLISSNLTFSNGHDNLPPLQDCRTIPFEAQASLEKTGSMSLNHLHVISQVQPIALPRAPAYTCTLCSRVFSSRYTLEYDPQPKTSRLEPELTVIRQHLQGPHPGKYRCNMADCSTMCSSKATLRRHLSEKHGTAPLMKIRCLNCNFSSPRKWNVERHTRICRRRSQQK